MLDAAVGDHGLFARAYKNGGNLTLADTSSGLSPGGGLSGCALGDLSGDGYVDYLGGGDQFSEGFYVAFGDGRGGWKSQEPAGLPPYRNALTLAFSNLGGLVLADLDRNRSLDIVAAGIKSGQGGNLVFGAVFLNGGDGLKWTGGIVYGPVPLGGSFAPSTLAATVADANGDGNLDVAVAGAVLLGDGKGAFKAQEGTNLPPAAHMHFGDMNGDGRMDLVLAETAIGLQVWLGDGTGRGWQLADVGLADAAIKTGGEAFGIDVGDLDGNGRLDVVRVIKRKIRDGSPFPTDADYDNVAEAWVR